MTLGPLSAPARRAGRCARISCPPRTRSSRRSTTSTTLYVNFDGITYAKGRSVLKQLAFYVGRTQFFEGIHNYLNRHAYSNATLADLLSELEKTSGRDLKAWSAKVAGGIRHQHDRHWPDRKRGRHHRRTEAHPERAGRTPGAAPASPGRRLLTTKTPQPARSCAPSSSNSM